MSKTLHIPQDNYRIKVQDSGSIFLDTGTNIGEIVPSSQIRLNGYSETGGSLPITNGVVTIPLNGKLFTVSVTVPITSIVVTKPTAPLCGLAVVYFIQDGTGHAIALPTMPYYSQVETLTVSEDANGFTQMTIWTDPLGNLHINSEVRTLINPA